MPIGASMVVGDSQFSKSRLLSIVEVVVRLLPLVSGGAMALNVCRRLDSFMAYMDKLQIRSRLQYHADWKIEWMFYVRYKVS